MSRSKIKIDHKIVAKYDYYQIVKHGDSLFLEVGWPYALFNFSINISEFWEDISAWKRQGTASSNGVGKPA